MLHQRSDKNSHLDTILYEIDMLRHCSKTLAAKRAKRDEAEEEYNLGIEGFLIHLRNLLAFLSTKHSRPHDLRLNDSEVWLGRRLEDKEYADLRDKTLAFNEGYSETFNSGKKLDCYELISKFLQHCTPERYEEAVVGWDIEKMSAEIEPILADFEKRFAPAPAQPQARVWASAVSSHSTATIRTSAVLVGTERVGPASAAPTCSPAPLHAGVGKEKKGNS